MHTRPLLDGDDSWADGFHLKARDQAEPPSVPDQPALRVPMVETVPRSVVGNTREIIVDVPDQAVAASTGSSGAASLLAMSQWLRGVELPVAVIDVAISCAILSCAWITERVSTANRLSCGSLKL
jgi:hypothetical protein